MTAFYNVRPNLQQWGTLKLIREARRIALTFWNTRPDEMQMHSTGKLLGAAATSANSKGPNDIANPPPARTRMRIETC